jgi:phytoene dehydrogenase-like protein
MKPIVIIGAGMAGLQVATQLHRKGVPCIIFEKSDRVGGRVKSDRLDGFTLDHGFQVLQTNYSSVQTSLDLDALNLNAFDSGAQLWIKGQCISFLNPLRYGLKLLELVPSVISFKDLFLLGRLWFKLQVSTDSTNVTESTAAMLDRWGFSASFQTHFLKPFFRGIYLDSKLQQPASLFFFYMRQFLEGQAALPANGMGELAVQMLADLPKDSLRLNAEVVKLDGNQMELSDGTQIEFERVIVALDPQHAAKLIQVELAEDVHLGSKTFYFFAPAQQIKDKLLHLIPGDAKLLHYCFLSHVAPSYAPAGKDLIQVTSLDLNLEADEVLALLAEYEDVSQFSFLKSYAIPRSLSRFGAFEVLKRAAQAKGILLAGDYCETPSLQGALVSGQKAAAESLI